MRKSTAAREIHKAHWERRWMGPRLSRMGPLADVSDPKGSVTGPSWIFSLWAGNGWDAKLWWGKMNNLDVKGFSIFQSCIAFNQWCKCSNRILDWMYSFFTSNSYVLWNHITSPEAFFCLKWCCMMLHLKECKKLEAKQELWDFVCPIIPIWLFQDCLEIIN